LPVSLRLCVRWRFDSIDHCGFSKPWHTLVPRNVTFCNSWTIIRRWPIQFRHSRKRRRVSSPELNISAKCATPLT
jgi:hypothetical protein